MTKHPKISVIIPSFNQAKFIEETIHSILDQNYPKLELIILDGGSTDGSVKIIEKYADRLAYWRSRPDEGQTHALIEGFEKASGDLMGWINSDDVLLPNALKCISSAYVIDPEVELFFGDVLLVDGQGKITRCHRVPQKGINWFAERGMLIFNSIATFFTRRAYDAVGGLHQDLSYVMDADLYVRMLLNGTRYQHVGRCLGGFRRHVDAKTVYGAKMCREEHNYAADKYWPPDATRRRRQRRWLHLYRVFRLWNGHLATLLDTSTNKGRHWGEWTEKD